MPAIQSNKTGLATPIAQAYPSDANTATQRKLEKIIREGME
jgi:hypothetical protein